MPERDVKTIQDLIFYQYAKIIARRAFDVPDGKEAKKRFAIAELYRPQTTDKRPQT